MQIQAQDLDRSITGITYSLTEPSQYFDLLSSGILILREPLDWEIVHEHHLFARAFDGKHSSTFDAEIRVNVINQNDNRPQFNPTIYHINISESFNILSSPVGQVVAQDKDSPAAGYLFFSVLGSNSPLRVDSMGYLYLTRQLDYEQKSQYEIAISVSDGEQESITPSQVVVNVIDENDNHPYFPQPTYYSALPENSPAGTLSLSISATDLDTSPANRNIASYVIQEAGVPFEVHMEPNGAAFLSNSHAMDYETDRHVFVLHVHAYDSGGLRSTYPAQVTISLEDVDDCTPEFSQSVYFATIRENNPIPLFITTLLATDCDVSLLYREIRYTLISPQGLVNVDPNSGSITAAKSFDFESEQSHYVVEVRAVSLSNTSQYDTATLNLTITDSNEYSPEFAGIPYHVSVPESVEHTRPIFKVKALDRDGGEIYGVITRYWIVQGSRSLIPFRLDSSSGELFLTRALDYESGDRRFDIPVVAMDGGSLLARTTIEVFVLNENDEEPYFTGPSTHNITIPEEVFPIQLPGLPDNALLQVGASDGDILEGTDLFYNLSNYDKFSIDTRGYLYVTRFFDFEEREEYQVEVSLSDGVFSARTSVLVRVAVENRNDHPPVFHGCLEGCCGVSESMAAMEVRVDENLTPHMSLASFSGCDIDGDLLQYYIYNSTQNGFELRANQLYLLTALDYEEVSSIHLYIGSFDGMFNSTNAVEVTVMVNNLDDNVFEFETDYYESIVDENTRPGDFHLPISASDRDTPMQDVLYSIPPVDDIELPFQIVSTRNGGYAVTNTETLDFESLGEWFLFNITAYPNSSLRVMEYDVAIVNITISDMNEFSPEFSSPMYNSTFPENTVGVIANVSALDRDAGSVYGHVSYNILHSPTLTCVINNMGEVMIEEPIDADQGSPMHHILVEAMDGGGLTTTAEVVVEVLDENDHGPQFSRSIYTLTVPENTPTNTSLLELSASDLDYSQEYSTISNYQITSTHSNLPFSVNSQGVLFVTQPLDFEMQYVYSFSIRAVDSGGLSSSSPATININVENIPDEPPVFLTTMYTATLAEGVSSGTVVARIHAHSPDGGLVQYFLTSQTNGLPFMINKYSGVITVNGSIDYEEQHSYHLTILCYLSSDPSIHSTASVTVQVTNINDHSPVMGQSIYNATIMENVPHRTFALEISASDRDSSTAGAIVDFQLLSTSTGFYVRDFNPNGTAIISNYKSFDKLLSSLSLLLTEVVLQEFRSLP